jgi:hypothetical protein
MVVFLATYLMLPALLCPLHLLKKLKDCLCILLMLNTAMILEAVISNIVAISSAPELTDCVRPLFNFIK